MNDIIITTYLGHPLALSIHNNTVRHTINFNMVINITYPVNIYIYISLKQNNGSGPGREQGENEHRRNEFDSQGLL